ncbi:MAG: DUF4190 domain-containing protein [Pirellulales bacterium]
MSTPAVPYTDQRTNDALEYRAVSSSAVASLVIGLLSVIVVLSATTSFQAFLSVCPIPLIGLVFGWRALSVIRRAPEEWTGRRFAVTGLLLSGGFLLAGFATASYVYATEVPEGYARISFSRLQPDERAVRRGDPVSQDILQLNGQKVFIKGYMRPSSQQFQLNEFLFVRDNNQCCFGALNKVKYFDQILVRTVGPLRVDYRVGLLRIGGILRVHPAEARLGPGHAVFTLEADYAK